LIQLALMFRRLGLPHRTRSDFLGVGYRGLVREYWRVRREMRTHKLAFVGFVKRSLKSEIAPVAAGDTSAVNSLDATRDASKTQTV
jgi:hypothetical protein